MPSSFPANTYPRMIVDTPNVIHYMRMGDSNVNTSGDDADSLSGSGVNCGSGGSAIAGDSNGSKYFNGSSSYINYGNTNALTTDFTIEVWVYPTTNYTSGSPTFLSKENWGGGGYSASGWSFWIQGRSAANGGMRAAFSYMGSLGTRLLYTDGIPANQWTYLVITRGGGTLLLYQNGVLKWDTPSGDMYTSNYVMTAGCASNYQSSAYSDYYNGYLDELAIYHRALSQTEITNHYNRALTAPNINTYLTKSDTDTMSESRTYEAVATMSMSDAKTVTRTETYTAQRGYIATDNDTITSTEVVNDIITEFMGDKLFLNDAVLFSSVETRSLSSMATLADDVQLLEDVPIIEPLSFMGWSDEHGVFGVKLDFFVLDLDRLDINPVIGPVLSAVEGITAYNVTESTNYGKIYRERVGLVHKAVYQRFPNAAQIQYPHEVVVKLGLPEDDYFVVLGKDDTLVALGKITTTWQGPFMSSRLRGAHQSELYVGATNENTVVEFFRNPYEHPEILELFGLPLQEVG